MRTLWKFFSNSFFSLEYFTLTLSSPPNFRFWSRLDNDSLHKFFLLFFSFVWWSNKFSQIGNLFFLSKYFLTEIELVSTNINLIITFKKKLIKMFKIFKIVTENIKFSDWWNLFTLALFSPLSFPLQLEHIIVYTMTCSVKRTTKYDPLFLCALVLARKNEKSNSIVCCSLKS